MRAFAKCAGILALSVCALAPARALADAPDAGVSDSPSWLAHRGNPSQPEARASAGGPVVVRSLAAIALLAGLGATALFLRKRRGEAPVVRSDFRIAVLGSTRVGPKAHAVVASVAGRVLLLGVTDSAVQKLAWLDGGPPLENADSSDDEDDAVDAAALSRDEISTLNAKAPTPPPSRITPGAAREPAKRRAKPAQEPAPAGTGAFRDLLSRFTKQEEQREKSGASSPAAILADSTHDVFDRARSRPEGASIHSLLPAGRTIEGQAKGLAARLQGRAV